MFFKVFPKFPKFFQNFPKISTASYSIVWKTNLPLKNLPKKNPPPKFSPKITPLQKDPKQQELRTHLWPRLIKDPITASFGQGP